MWYSPAITVAAASEPVTLAQAKSQCRVESADEDTYISGLIASARAYVEAYCGTPLVSRTVTVKCDGFADFAAFPVLPLTSVSSVSYVDAAGDTQTLSASVYDVRADGLTASLALKADQSWPSVQAGSRVTVAAVVGYSAIPDDVKHALLLLIGHWFENRSDGVEAPHSVTALLANRRVFGF